MGIIPDTTFFFAPGNYTTIYETDFESFITGSLVACQDGIHWTTWYNAPCGPEDAMVSTDFAHSGTKSVKDHGANDLVLPLGNKVTGKYQFDFWMYIPSGHSGYYNILHNFAPGAYEWGLEFYFEDAGTGQLHAGGQIIPYLFNHDQWFHIVNVIDIDNDLAEVLVDGTSVYSWQWSLDPSTGNPGLNQLSAVDFYSGTGIPGIVNPLYYFDDVKYKQVDGQMIIVSPASLNQEMKSNDTVTQTLNISNAGDVPLDFSIDISYPVNSVMMAGKVMKTYNWLSATPLTGSVPVGGDTNLRVTFISTGLGVGTYNGLLSFNTNDPSNPVKVVPVSLVVTVLKDLPFVEDWSSGTFSANVWRLDPAQSNWTVSSSGNPAPCASFVSSPAILNYSQALVSPLLNTSDILDNVTLQFDIKLDNNSTSTLEGLAVEVSDGATFQLVHDYSNVSGSFNFISGSFNITSLAAGHNFMVRFRTYGANSINVNSWFVDNIKIYQQIIGDLSGTINKLVNGSPVEGAVITISNVMSGTYSSFSGTNGDYNIPDVEAGSYTISVEKDGFNVIEGNVNIIGYQTVTMDFMMTAPVISVDPTSITVNVNVGEITTSNVTINNTGNGPVAWNGNIHYKSAPGITLYATDFESFTVGAQVACQDPVNWNTWSNAPCGGEDAYVSEDYAHSGIKSIRDNGYNDQVLLLENKTSGKYELSFEMFIPSGHGGYYSMLHDFSPGSYVPEWALELYFEDAGTGQLHAGGQFIPFTYNHDQWFDVSNIIDLDNDFAEVFLDGVPLYSWQWSLELATGQPGINKLAAIDLYSGYSAPGVINPLYYFDDILYKSMVVGQQTSLPDNVFSTQLTSWLSLEPNQGSIPAGLSQNMIISLDATNLTVGEHTGSVLFICDPNIYQISIPVRMRVNPLLPDTLNIPTTVVHTGESPCYNATQTIIVGGNGKSFLVSAGGSATMIAGQNILYLPNTTVQSGGYMWGYITPNGQFCGTKAPSVPAVITGEENPIMIEEKASFKVYPNPTTGNFILELTGDIQTEKLQVDVYGIWVKRCYPQS